MKELTDLSVFTWAGTPQRGKYLGMEFLLYISRRDYRLVSCFCHPSDKLLRIETCCEVEILPTAHYLRRNSTVFSLEYVRKGSLLVRQRGRGYELEQGELFLMQPGCESEFLSGPGGCHKLSVLFSGQLLQAFLQESGLYEFDVLKHPCPQYFERLFQNVLNLGTEKIPRAGRIPSLAFDMLQSMFFPPEPENIPAPLKKLLEEIESHPENDWNQGRMASVCGCSATHLVRLCHRYLHMTPGQYLNDQRMRKAHQYMTDDRLSIKEIAALCGFNDAMNFSTGFHRKFGMSPRDFRRRLSFL